MKLLVVIQARMGSTRLPGKVLLPLAGRPLLERMIERVRAASTPFDLVVATTTDDQDRPIRDLCRAIDVPVVCGHPTDLIARHVQAGRERGADAVAKIPSDCPLINPSVIDRVLGAFLAEPERWDLVTNLAPPTYPDGNDVEVLPARVLDLVDREARRPHEREHTTPFVWDQPERFRVQNVPWPTGLDYSGTHRLTIDHPEDYAVIREVFERLWTPRRPVFGLDDILQLMDREPAIRLENARYHGTSWHHGELHRLRTVRVSEEGALSWS